MDQKVLVRRAAAALAKDRSASMGDLAARIGVGRATLHRHFSSRSELAAAVADFAVFEVRRIYDEAGIDDRPVLAVLQSLADGVLDLAVAYELLWSDPLTAEIAALKSEWELDEQRLERFAERGQADGLFRTNVPAALIAYSIGAQAFVLQYAVNEGHVGARATGSHFLTTILQGFGGPEPRAAG